MRETSMMTTPIQIGERCFCIILLLILATPPWSIVNASDSSEILKPEETEILKTIIENHTQKTSMENFSANNERLTLEEDPDPKEQNVADEINLTENENTVNDRVLEELEESQEEEEDTSKTNETGKPDNGGDEMDIVPPSDSKAQESHPSEVEVGSNPEININGDSQVPETEPLSARGEAEESDAMKVGSPGKVMVSGQSDKANLDDQHDTELDKGYNHGKYKTELSGEQDQDYLEDGAEPDEDAGETRNSVHVDTVEEAKPTIEPTHQVKDAHKNTSSESDDSAAESPRDEAIHKSSLHGESDEADPSSGAEEGDGHSQEAPFGGVNDDPVAVAEDKPAPDVGGESQELKVKTGKVTEANEDSVGVKVKFGTDSAETQDGEEEPRKAKETNEGEDFAVVATTQFPEISDDEEKTDRLDSLKEKSTEDELDEEARGPKWEESNLPLSDSIAEADMKGKNKNGQPNLEPSLDFHEVNEEATSKEEDVGNLIGEEAVNVEQDDEVPTDDRVASTEGEIERTAAEKEDDEDQQSEEDLNHNENRTETVERERVDAKHTTSSEDDGGVNHSGNSLKQGKAPECSGDASESSGCRSESSRHEMEDASVPDHSKIQGEDSSQGEGEQFVNDNAEVRDAAGTSGERGEKFEMPKSFMEKEKETASLAFVFDTTGSMHDDLMQAQDGAKAILRTFLEHDTIPVSNYILVPFNDPLIGPITVTEDPADFVKVLDQLTIEGGDDCPEMSTNGILQALEKAHPNSFLYVFTDAPPKDYNVIKEVLDAVQRKHSQVNFFLSGLCSGKMVDEEAYKVYDKVAVTSRGQVFLMTKDDINRAMDYLRQTLRSRSATVYSVNRPQPLIEEPHSEDFNITVEKDLNQLTVILTGNQPTIDVRNPAGETPKDVKTILDLPNAVVVNVDDPKPAGTWNVNITVQPKEPGSKSKTIPDGFTLVAKGTGSVYQIVNGFSLQPAGDIKETAKRPLEGTENYLTVEVHPLEEKSESTNWLKKYDWKSVDFLKMDGGVIWSLPLKKIESEEDEESKVLKFTAGPFSPPDELFSLSFNGMDGDANPVTRLSSNAISPQPAAPPLITMKPTLKGVSGKNFSVHCQVESLLPFTLEWYKNGIFFKGNMSYNQSADALLVIGSLMKEDEGVYICSATNKRGSTKSPLGTMVDVIEPPVIANLVTPKAIIPENSNAVLDCEVKSDLNHSVQWSHERQGKIVDITSLPDKHRYQQLKNNSLLILSVKNSDSGLYVCGATNLAGTSTKEIKLLTLSPPELVTSPEDNFYFTKGEDIVIECKIVGDRAANISWEFDGVTTEQFSKPVHDFVSVISIPQVDNRWAGRFVCVAVNEAGKAHKEVIGIYFEPPLVQPETSPFMALKEGEDATMSFSVVGKPNMTVHWTHDGKPIINSEKYQISPDGLSLKVHNFNHEDEGTYVGEALGMRGTKDSSTFEVRLGTPPKPRLIPYDTSLNLGEDGWFNCSSEDQGDNTQFPEMAVQTSWKRENGVPLDLVRHEVLESGTLHIIDADIADEGIYICSLENAFGKIDHEMELQLTGFTPPLITGMLQPKLSVPENKSVLMNCTVISDSEYEVRWIHHRGGLHEEIPLWEDERVQQLENKSLLILNLREDDSGIYECRAGNRAGETTKEMELLVISPPKISTIPDHKFEFFKGESISIDCSVNNDTLANISWEFNGLSLNKLSKSKNNYTKSVTIPYTDEEWEGIYMCIAVNEAGKVQKEVLGIYVQPPEIIPESKHVAVKMGGTAEMRCTVNGKSSTSIIWFHNDHILTNGSKYQISSDGESLKVFDSSAKDEGLYKCVVEGPRNSESASSIDMIIGVPPKPKQPYPYASLKFGEEGLFPCVVEDESKISLFPGMASTSTWKRKNKPLDSERHSISESGALLITNATTSDDGVYVCTLENDFGKIDLEMDLEIIGLVPPMMAHDDDEESTYLDGETVVLWCNASGLPNPTISWFYKKEGMSGWERLGEQYYNVEGMSITGGKLSIHNASSDNQGLYSCTAENDAGFTERIHYVNMKAPPVLMDNDGPVDISLVEGESFSLSCTAKGAPEPTIKWIKDGIDLPKESFDGSYHIVEDGAVLEILMAKSGRSDGYYTCSAENSAGRVQKSFKVKILVPPAHGNSHFGRNVATLRVKLDDPLTITCPIATGLAVPAPTYGWSKDGKMLHSEEVITSDNGITLGHLQIRNNGKNLHIDRVTLDDAGNYSCVGFNRAGRVISPAAEVVVSIAPTHMANVRNSSVYDAIKGENITFNCSVMGIPKPKVIWTKDGNYLSENQPDIKYNYITQEQNTILSQLTIINVQGYHAGSYKCLSNNPVGKSSILYDLSVLVPPYVLGQENNILEVGEGESVTLACAVTGNPKPNITWYKINDEHHEKLRKNRIPNPSSLEISNIHKDDTGIYVCSGTNGIGSVKMSFNVSVLVAPSLEGSAPVFKVVAVGENITLKCSPSGSPIPTLRWFKNGYLIGTTFHGERNVPNGNSIIISKDGQDMLIKDASKDDDGNYTCISYNKAGKIERTFHIETIAQPLLLDWNIPDFVKVLNGSKVSFDCTATGKPTPKIDWTRISPQDNLTTVHKTQNQPLVDSRGVTASTVQLAFESIEPEDSAVYICKAENKAGSTLKRFHLDVHVPPLVEGYAGDENGEPDRIGVIKKQPGSFTVQVVAGQTFTLSCRIVFGRPTPHLLWLRNGKKILKNIHQSRNPYRYTVDDQTSIATHGVYVIDSDETLVLSNITEEESGPYKCAASNEAGTSEVNFNVEVFVPPSLEEGSNVETVFSVKVYSFIALVCPVTGNPVPDIKWFKDSEEIDEEYANVFQMSQDKRRLIIMQAKVENTGEYTCVATNEAGTKKINYKVSVLDEQSEWSPWSSWSACSSSCGSGTRKRYRECSIIQPNLKQLVPSYYRTSDNQIDLSGQASCPGEDVQVQKCVLETCPSPDESRPAPEEYRVRSRKKKVKRVPKRASLSLQGKLNGQSLSSSHASASFNPWNSGPTLEAEVEVDPYQQGNMHPYLPFILSPLTWSAAGEIDDASNGYSLTDGVFEQHSQLEFTSGETLYLSHKGQGVDTNTGELKVEIEVEGEVPQYQSDSMVYLAPYSQNYVQTSPSSLYAWTENDLNVDGKKIPYKWNSSLHYDSSLGTMSYLAEQLSLEDMNTYNDYDNHKIVFSSSPKISKKYQTNRCPDGFNSDEENLHCIDIDECADGLSECHESQRCKNEIGGYQCVCPEGFTSKSFGHPCIDINECNRGKNPCSHDCYNTQGSYYCTCPKGLELHSDKHTCERQDASPSAFEKTKLPMLDLLPDYHIIPLVTLKPPAKFWSSVDQKQKGLGVHSKDAMEEIQEPRWADDEFNKKCSSGFEFIGGKCQDIDECVNTHRIHRIRHQSHKQSPCPLPGQRCVNTNGSYHCIEMSCSSSYNEVEVDISAKKESLIYCLQLCDTSGPPCQEKAEVAQIVINSIITISSLKPRRALAQFSVPITARIAHNETKTLASTTRTTFHKLEDETGSSNRQVLQLFRVRSEGTDGILYSMKEFNVPGFYRVAVMALTYNGYSHHVLYATKFVLNIYVTGH